jgi:hypothetical protein
MNVMKKTDLTIACLLALTLVWNACKEDYYTINDDSYNDKTIEVKNTLVNDTLQIELFNTDQISVQEVSDPDIIFDPRAFIYTVEHDSILAVSEDGIIQPLARGVSKIFIEFRANPALATSVIVEVHKDYHPVERLQVPAAVANLLVEQGYTLDLSPYIVVFPEYADNKQLHFTMDDASQAFASVSDSGLITGITPSEITIHIVSDDNPEVTATAKLTVVSEIEITDIVLHAKLDTTTLGLGETINLDEVTGVLPANVNVVNRKLKFEVISGSGVVLLEDALLTAAGAGTARLKVTAKNNISKEFTVHVDADKRDLTRNFWTVTTSALYSNGQNYVTDGSTGKPEDMFDENAATFLSLTKPGKTYNGSAGPPAGSYNYFIVDMKAPCRFSSIRWNHRSGNSYPYLRVWGIDLEGSSDGETWETIRRAIALPNTSGAATGADNERHDIPLTNEYEYRYVKVSLTQWSDNSGGETSGSTMQIGEFGLTR